MASYLQPNNTPQFTPYISTVPVDLYGKLIVDKQSQYELGVQKTQSYIDNITGLKVGRPEDEEYLRTKVASLKQNIGEIVASDNDFSNPNVLRQVGAIASGIYNDKRIQRDVISAANANDAFAQIEQAKEKGTWSQANEDLIMSNVQAWSQGGNQAGLGKQSYIAYQDYSPKLNKFLKDIVGDVRVDENSPLGADGRPLPYVLQNNKIMVISPERIKVATDSFFLTDAQARTQRDIDARFSAKNMSDYDALTQVASFGQGEIDRTTKAVDDIKRRQSLLTKDDERYNQYEQEIKSGESYIAQIAAEQTADIDRFATDKQGVKSKVYYRNLVRGLQDTFSHSERSTTYESNPLFTNQLAEQKFTHQQNMDNQRLEIDRAKLNVAQMKAANATNPQTGLPQGTSAYGVEATFTQQGDVDNSPITYEEEKKIYDAERKSNLDQQAAILLTTYGAQSGVTRNAQGNYQYDADKIAQDITSLKKDYEEGNIKNPHAERAASVYFSDMSTTSGYGQWLELQERNEKLTSIEKANLEPGKYYHTGKRGGVSITPVPFGVPIISEGVTAMVMTPEGEMLETEAVQRGYTPMPQGRSKRVNEQTKELLGSRRRTASLIIPNKDKGYAQTFSNIVSYGQREQTGSGGSNSGEWGNILQANKDKKIDNISINKKSDGTFTATFIGTDIDETVNIPADIALNANSAFAVSEDRYQRVENEASQKGSTSFERIPTNDPTFAYVLRRRYVNVPGVGFMPEMEYKPKDNDAAQWLPLTNINRQAASSVRHLEQNFIQPFSNSTTQDFEAYLIKTQR